MTASELHRKLLYCGYDDLSVYLKCSILNRQIHRQLLGLRLKYNLKTPILTLFNEIYYQLVKIQSDRRPGEDVVNRYLHEEEQWLGDRDSAMLVLCMASALIQAKLKLSFNDECFLSQFTPIAKKSVYIVAANDLLNFLKTSHAVMPYDFSIMSAPIESIRKEIYPTNDNPWRTITDNLSSSAIEWYITLYHQPPFQLDVYERIYAAFTFEERNDNSAFLRQLRVDIEAGNYMPGTRYFKKIHPDTAIIGNLEAASDFLNDLTGLTAVEAEPAEEAQAEPWREQLQRERDEAVRKCVEQQKSHELDVARLKAEIADLKQQLECKPKAKTKPAEADSYAEPDTKTIPITVEEMIDYVKKEFTHPSAVEFSLMLYQMANDKDYRDKDFKTLIESILVAIRQRDALYQTYQILDPHQVNINSEVENKYNEQNN